MSDETIDEVFEDEVPQKVLDLMEDLKCDAEAEDVLDEPDYDNRAVPDLPPSVLLEKLSVLWRYPIEGEYVFTDALAEMAQAEELSPYKDRIAKLQTAFDAYAESTETVVGASMAQLDYTRMFIGSFKMYAPPYASYYLDGAEQIFGPTAVATDELYAQFGLQISQDEHDMPDHIRYMLTFMGVLVKAYEKTGEKDVALAYEDFKAEFVDTWVDQLSEKIHTYTEYPFFKELIDFTIDSI